MYIHNNLIQMPRTYFSCPKCGKQCIRADGCSKHSEKGKKKRKEALSKYRKSDEFKVKQASSYKKKEAPKKLEKIRREIEVHEKILAE